MRFEIILAAEAVDDMRKLSARNRSTLRDAIEIHLRHRPEMESRSRIKRLQGLSQPQYRLRVDEFRVYYDVDLGERTVAILGVVPKSASEKWLATWGIPK